MKRAQNTSSRRCSLCRQMATATAVTHQPANSIWLSPMTAKKMTGSTNAAMNISPDQW